MRTEWERKNVDVNLDYLDDGTVVPRIIYFEDDVTKKLMTFVVDHAGLPEHAAAKGGGFGLRYKVILTCEEEDIHRKTTYLYFEKDADPEVWFVDKKVYTKGR